MALSLNQAWFDVVIGVEFCSRHPEIPRTHGYKTTMGTTRETAMAAWGKIWFVV
jgi:hypothetical protein